jgi:uncharacterized damage-inducible protein DinB
MANPMTVEQADFLLHNVFLGLLKNESRMTRAVLAAIPPDKPDYRPDPNGRSVLDLAWHIALAEPRFLDAVLNGEFSTAPRPRPEGVHTGPQISEWYGMEFDARFAKLAQLHGEPLAKIVDFRGLFQMPAVLFAQVGVNHTIHHRGQLSTYLRPMGGKVPAIYGESYDTAQARQAAQA